ncbi:DUF6884 domain-containing protein [Streptomyces althioticus]|uniref:DUF6884 domain-containing protein n=1 Tax=Streptomyces althioticus TaxID=83380 RepID=UPI00371BCE4A
MGDRFATSEDVRRHWRLEEGDRFRITETKDEAANRRSTVWRREERANDLELVGEHLVVARMHYPDSGRYRWGVFHAGTAQPVLMLQYEDVKASDDGARARALAEALDQWRDPATREPFDWTSEGLVDRLRSPYGRALLDQVRGEDPEARWAGAPPADAEPWETDDGLEYAFARDGGEVRVYDPDGLLIARGKDAFDVRTKKSAYIGEMRDGRRIAGRRSMDFIENAVWQHRIAQLEPAARDTLWIYYLDNRPIVHGTDRYDADLKALLRSSGFTWSGYAKAYVTAGTTRAVARAQSVDRLARALYAQGRMVEIRADENRLRGILAPAVPAPAAAGAKVLVPVGASPTGQASPAAPSAPSAEPVLVPGDLTDEQLAAELERLKEERNRTAFGSPRHTRLDEQIAPLQQEHDQRQVAQVHARPDPAGMEDGEIAAEREALAAALGRPALGYENRTALAEARRERDEVLRVEQARRTAAELEARTPVVQMTDEELQAEGAQLVKERHRRPPEAADAFTDRVAAVGKEIADRRLRAWGEQPPAETLDDIELTEALKALRGQRLSDTEFAGSYPAMERVEKAFKSRRQELLEEIKQRDEKAFEALLKADGRVRLVDPNWQDGPTRVKIDGRWYGQLREAYPGTRASVWRGRDVVREEVWRTDALRWLLQEYEADPETSDTRTWGAYVGIELPPSFVDQLTSHSDGLGLSAEAEKYLIGRLAGSSRTQSFDERGKKIMVHALDLPERTLPVLEHLGRRLVDLLDDELDSDDRKVRDRAKRARPNVLRTVDDLGVMLESIGLEPVTADDAAVETPQDGETDGERVREDGPSPLGDLPAAGAGLDGGSGGVLPGAGEGRPGADRGADHAEDGRGNAGDGPAAAGGQVEGGTADGPGAGAEGDRVPGAGGGQPGRGAAPLVFRPVSQDDLAPAGERAKAAANLEAVRVLKRVQEEERPPTAAEQQVMARWSGWGSVPEIFAARPREDDPVFGPGGEREGGYTAAVARWESFADVRDPLRALLDDDEWRAAAASTLSAHYTPPEITSALWQTLLDLGFDGGEVLEPGSGAGVSFGTAPESARMTGVEIEPTSAAISRLLAPGVTVLNESFADTLAPDGAFDGVVGNVPFARVSLYDAKHNRGRHRIHNHFLIKSVALTRPGGVVALITSRHTLDAENSTARSELFEMADLLGAVRLPNKAFARSAGTDVVTDVLVLRRRMDGEEPLDQSWLTAQKREVDGHRLAVNDYFTAHPEHVLGTLTSRMGAHGPEIAVDGDPDVSASVRTALRQITDAAVLARRWYQPHPDGPYRPPLRLRPAAEVQDFTGRLSADAEGKLWQTSGDGELVAVDLPPKQHAQLALLIELKDLVRGLNDLDRSGTDMALADAQRRLTRETYERYVADYGRLSRPGQQQNVTIRTDDGESVAGLTAWGYFLNDPQAYEVLALEMWEADTDTVHVSEILNHAPAVRRSILGQHTDDPQQALDAVVAERGFVDLPHIAWMLQVDENEARRRLARSVFTDPLTGDLLHSADYLSGDVRTKLEIARQAAKREPAFEVNVAELERVQPREMLPGQFAIRLGAVWIPEDLVQQFFREYLGDGHLTIQHSGGGNWHIRKGRGLSEENEVKHSAGGLAPLALLNRVLNGGSMTGRPSDDEEAARAVRVKAEEWRDAFEAWVLDDSFRAARAADVYNRVMNNRTVRDFTGSRPSLAGLDPDFTPYDHQLAAAARMAHERCLVLSHVVGAGKTATLAIGMMAMRNTGQVDKPLAVVPNFLVEAWEKEVRRLFPAARILTLTSADLADGKRDRVLQYVRANSFDMVIMSHSLFDSIPLSPEFYEFYNDEELRKLDAQILHERRREGKSISLKQLQERRQQHEEDLKAKAGAARSPGQVFLDDLGFDFFAVDEAHEYKNLAVRSKIPGARVEGSAKAQHLHAALEWARRNKPKGPVGCLATATPLSNAIGELHTLLMLAAPERLRALGIEEFDAFAAMYGRMVERLEMTVDGKGFKSVERFASFHSVNSLLRQLWLPVVDFKDEDDLGLPLPSIKGGEPELMLVPATEDQRRRMQELGERYEAFHQGEVDKSEDNPLSINNDARVIALDPRLIDPEAEPGNKLRLLADRVAAKYHETKNDRYAYSTEDPRPHPVPGALQMVFINQGTPKGKNRGGFNAYQEFKDLLVERGVPADKIDFIHDAERADQRRRMVARANHGDCNVLLGSTQRMGKGLNAQNRLVSLYHADPDYRPSDMKQKDGRALRKGNQNKVVEIVWAATEGTFDSRSYGILATKAKGFDQLYKARLDTGTDEIQEVDEAIVPYEEAMAIISGNPYLIAQEELRKQLRTLTLDQNNRATQRAIVFRKIQQLHKEIDELTWNVRRRGSVLPSLRPVLGDDFSIQLGKDTYTRHKDAAAPLKEALAGVLQALPQDGERTREARLGHLGGLDLVAVAYREDRDGPFLRVHLDGLPGSLQRFTADELGDLKGETLLRRLTRAISEAPDRQLEEEGNLKAKKATRDELMIYSEQLRGQVPGLARLRERLSLVEALVAAQITVNKAGDPKEDEPPAETEARRQAIAHRDELQQQLDRLEEAAPPAEEASPEVDDALLYMEDRRLSPQNLNESQIEAETAALNAHVAVHGDPEGKVSRRLAALSEKAARLAAARGEPAEPVRSATDPDLEPTTEPGVTSVDTTPVSSSSTSPAQAEGHPPEQATPAVASADEASPASPSPADSPDTENHPQPLPQTSTAAEGELWDGVPGIAAGPGVVQPGMHIEYLPEYRPGARSRHAHGGVIVRVGTTHVRWRPYAWHQDLRTPLAHMRIDAGRHLNQREESRRWTAAREAGEPLPQAPEWTTWSLAEHLAHASEHRSEEEATGPLVIIPCGSAKLDHKAPAGELYVGPYHRSCRDAADALTAEGGTVLILSARYGLVTLDQEIEPYDLRMGQLGSVTVEQLREQARDLGADAAENVIILGGEAYTNAALQVWPQAATPLAGLSGMGYQRQYLAEVAALPPGSPLPLPSASDSAGSDTALQEMIDGFDGRVVIGHVGNKSPAPAPPAETAEQSGAPAKTDGGDSTDQPPAAAEGDGYGTADLFDAHGLPQPERVPAAPAQDDQAAQTEAEGPAGVPAGQMTVNEVQPKEPAAPAPTREESGRERLTSADGRLTFTLQVVPADAEFHQEAVEGYQRLRSELASIVDAKDEQAAQTAAEQAAQLARWRRTYKAANGLEPFRPLPALRLTKREDAPGLTPAEYGIGSWVTWQDEQSGQQVTGQVMSPGPSTNTWYVSTDRTGHTGEYHVLSRSGKKTTGYSYSLNGAVTDLRPADGPGEQRPLENLPEVDSIPFRPVTSYADYAPKGGLAPVREPIPVTVGEMGPRFDPTEVAFDVTADGIRFVVSLNQDDDTLTSLFVPRVEADGEIIKHLAPAESRGEAIESCVRAAREARDLAGKQLYGNYRVYDLDVAADGVCGRCSHEGENDVQPLYRLNGSDPRCVSHLERSFGVKSFEVEEVAAARRMMAARVSPEPEAAPAAEQPAAPSPVPGQSLEQQKAVTPASAESTEPHDIARDAIRPGDLITVVVSGRSVEWDGASWGPTVPETVTVTGTVYPGYRDHRQSATLLDAVILDQDGTEVAAGNDVFVRWLPTQVRVTPAGHRDDLRPERRPAGQLRLGDLIAEGGTRGESITEARFGSNALGSITTFFTRDVAQGSGNSFTLANTDEVLVVPRERRPPQDVAAVFGSHGSHDQVVAEVQRTYDLWVAVADAVSRVWPDGTGPQEEIRALNRAVGAIDDIARGVDGYRANAAAMETAAAAAQALFAAADDDMLNRHIGLPLHRLRQHLDVQAQRLHADVAYLSERAAAAQTVEAPTASESDTEARQSASVAEGQATVAEAPTETEGTSAGAEGTSPSSQPSIDLVAPPTLSSDPPESLQQSEQRFGGPEQLAQYAGRADVIPASESSSSVWLDGRLIGYVTDLNQTVGAADDESWPVHMRRPSGPRFQSRPPFGHFESVAGLFEDRRAAVAELVARALQVPVPHDVIDADTAFTLQRTLMGVSISPTDAGEDQEAVARLSALRQVVVNLNAGQLSGASLADDLALTHDELLWAADLPNSPGPDRLTQAAEELAVLLAATRPEDPRAWRPEPFVAAPADAEQPAPAPAASRTRARRQESAAAPGAGTEQLGLFGDTAQDAEEGPGASAAAGGSEAVSDDEAPAQPENSREVQLRAALIEGETIDRVSFTDLREPAAGWILTTAAGHTFRLRPAAHALPDADHWEAGHDADGSYWWKGNVEDWPLAGLLERIREDSATRTRFAALWDRYGHLTAQAPPFETTTERVQLEEGVYLIRRFGRSGLIASCRWGWEHLTGPDGAQGHTGEDWDRRGPDNRQYVAEWKVWSLAQEAIPNARLRVVSQLTDDMAETPDAYCDASAPYVGKCSAKRSGSRYTVAVVDDQGSELGTYTMCARCLSHRLMSDEDKGIRHHEVLSVVESLAKGDPKVVDLHWKQWPDRIAELAGQMLSAALDAGESAPWPAQALTSQILTDACDAGDDRTAREARAEVKAAGGNAAAQKRAATEAVAARQDRAALVARRGAALDAAAEADPVAAAVLGLAGWRAEDSDVAPETAPKAAIEAVDVSALAVSPVVRNGEPSSYEFTVTGPGLTVGEYHISHDNQGRDARGIMWQAWWHGVEPSGRRDVLSIGAGEGESAALAAVAEHAARTGGDLAAGFAVARRMRYDAGLWVLPKVGESEAIQYHPDGSWTITAETGALYTVRREWEGRTASGDLAPLLIEDQSGALIASCTAVDGYMSAWAPMLERLRLHATAVAEGVPHATAVTLGGPGRTWVEAWCVCSWTERADAAEYADRAPAGEALAAAHHQETSAAAEAPAAAELRELDVVLPDVDLTTLDVAGPYDTDEEAQADIERLSTAFAQWEALPSVQRFYEADRRQRSDGRRIPTNPVAQLAAAYRDAERMLREGPAASPDDLVLEVHTVAVWSGVLEPVVDEDLRGPLRQVREAATLLASRSRATVAAFESEEQNVASPESAAADTEPAEQPPATAADTPETGTEQGLDAPAPAAEGLGEEPPASTLTTTDTEPVSAADDTPEPAPQEAPEPPAAADDAPGNTTADTAHGDTAESSSPARGVPVPKDTAEPAVTAPDEGMPEARREASFLEQDRPQTADGDHQAPEPDTSATPTDPAEEGAPGDETAQDASEEPTMTTPPIPDATAAPQEPIVEDPPEPQRYIDITDLDGDSRYSLRLSGFDGQPVDSGEVLHGDRLIATLHPDPEGGWLARLAADGLPADVTYVLESPEEAGVHAAMVYSAYTGAPAGPRAEAAPGAGPSERVDALRANLRDAAVYHRAEIVSAAARAYAAPGQNVHARNLVSALDGLAAAVTEDHGSQQMMQHLDAVRQAVNNWGGALPADPDHPERRNLAYPLARTLYDTRLLQEQVHATLAAVQAERAAVRQQAAPTDPQPGPEVRPEPAAGTAPGSPEESTESRTPEVPDSQTNEAAREKDPAASAEPTDVAGTVSQDGAALSEGDGPDLASTVDGIRRSLEDALQATQPEASAQPGELPLWTGAQTPPADTAVMESPAGPLDVRAEFQAVLEAWEEHVPPQNGTAQDLVADLDADLATLQRAFAEAVTPAAPAAAPAATGQDSAAPDESAEAEEPSSVPQQAADVNTALQQADTHATALQDLPEWQKIQTVRGAFGHLFRVMKERAGEQFDRLMGDGRVGEFFLKVSIAACDKVAGWAQAAADRLRRQGERDGADVPAADALRDVVHTTTAYASPGGDRSGPPPASRDAASTTVGIPAMRRIEEALSRPLPGAKDGRGALVSAAAARGKSTTRRGTKKPNGTAKGAAAEQAGHLRRDGVKRQEPNRKPTQR